jgi:hypothetical protein
MKESHDHLLDAIAHVMEEEHVPGFTSSALMCWSWTDENGDEQISLVSTPHLSTHSMLGMGEWIKSVALQHMVLNYQPDEEGDG